MGLARNVCRRAAAFDLLAQSALLDHLQHSSDVVHPSRWRRAVKNKIRELRGERGWSQAVLADKLEVSRQSVNAIETGRYDPSLPLAFSIARLFGVPIEEIFAGHE